MSRRARPANFGTRMLEYRRKILDLSPSFVVRAFAGADAAEIGPPGRVAEFDKRTRQGLRHLVVECSAEKRMRMGHQCNAS